MAETIHLGPAASPATVEEVVDYVHRNVAPRDFDALVSAAPLLQRLALDTALVHARVEKALVDMIDGRRTCFYTPQSFVIASVGSILLRGNLWCPTGPRRGVRSPRDAIFSYYMAHDHNYHFLTVGQFGPGYLTEIYETDPLAHDGRPGTTIDITLLEETALPTGKVMAYRAHRDIHVQLPPDSLSVSLNLMVRDMRSDTQEQYAFDIGECRSRAVITGYPDASPVSVQASLVELAGHLPDAGIQGLLHDLCGADHIAPRVRRHAVESLRASAWTDEDGLLRLARRIPDSRQWEARLLD